MILWSTKVKLPETQNTQVFKYLENRNYFLTVKWVSGYKFMIVFTVKVSWVRCGCDLEPSDGHETAGWAGVHVILGVPVHVHALGRPVLDVAGAVNHGKVGSVSAGTEGVSLSHSVEVAEGFRTHISNLFKTKMYFKPVHCCYRFIKRDRACDQGCHWYGIVTILYMLDVSRGIVNIVTYNGITTHSRHSTFLHNLSWEGPQTDRNNIFENLLFVPNLSSRQHLPLLPALNSDRRGCYGRVSSVCMIIIVLRSKQGAWGRWFSTFVFLSQQWSSVRAANARTNKYSNLSSCRAERGAGRVTDLIK